MKKRKILRKGLLRAGLSLLLSAMTVLTLVVPGVHMDAAQPENPVGQQTVEEIEALNLGENISQMNTIVVPSGGSAPPTEPMEPDDRESDQEQTEPNETIPQETESQQPDINDGEEGNEEDNQGEEGGQELQLDLAAVMTWYQYGNDATTIVCAPDKAVAKTLNTAQLKNDELRYVFSLKGDDARYVTIRSVTVTPGDAQEQSIREEGTLTIELPNGVGKRNYTFRIQALAEKRNDEGKPVTQEVEFAFVLRCEFAIDMEMDLNWRNAEGRVRTITCGPDKAEAIAVRNYELNERVFVYTTELTGSLAENAEIVDAQYTTASGVRSGTLEKDGGSLILNCEPGTDTETYYLTFAVKTQDRTVLYTYNLVYQETLDVELSFVWRDKGRIEHPLVCKPAGSASDQIKHNQISGGGISYEMELTGKDAKSGTITSVSYVSEGDSGRLESSDTLPLSMPEGATSNTYRITVEAMVSGQNILFEILLHHSNDVTLEMHYTVYNGLLPDKRIVSCENAKSRTAEEPVYDDELSASGGVLAYEMNIVDSEGENVRITQVTCFQTGTGRNLTLEPDGEVKLHLDNGKTGDNAFRIQAEDSSGNAYTFEINIPYKHRGSNSIQIETNLTDGQHIPNGVKTNLTVKARSEDAAGNTLGYILATGTDTKLIVKLDGVELDYISSSGVTSEYDIVPTSPEEGDTNRHILEIYAEDAYGNYGQLQLNLIGEVKDAGAQIGTATIHVDMTVLGLGVVKSVSYDVLASEPVSYVIAKAVLGEVLPEPFGQARETMGWTGTYEGTLDLGFYLQSLSTGHTANALEGNTWPGSTEAEVLAAIDDQFGSRTGLATLWRCLYRNGLDKSTGSGGTFGEFDYTSGSGWMYSVGGTTYYPGQSMSATFLQDGDVLTLRYTLAQGWDVGGGNPGYSSTVGYCVSAVNGEFRIRHQMESRTDEAGNSYNVCRCCGLEENCSHDSVSYRNEGNGTHVQVCENPECGATVGDWEYHEWGQESSGDYHVCQLCGAEERHYWIVTRNTATCAEPGERFSYCDICLEERVEPSDAKKHDYLYEWLVTDDNAWHYMQCGNCGEASDPEWHIYSYSSRWDDYMCDVCQWLHDDLCGYGSRQLQYSDCSTREYFCETCGHEFTETGSFHEYEAGFCLSCGEQDPDHVCPHDTWSDWITDSEPDCGNEGWQFIQCEDCGDILDEQPIPATGEHEFMDGICIVCDTPDPDYVPQEEPDSE